MEALERPIPVSPCLVPRDLSKSNAVMLIKSPSDMNLRVTDTETER